jgi:hypothetical protein
VNRLPLAQQIAGGTEVANVDHAGADEHLLALGALDATAAKNNGPGFA